MPVTPRDVLPIFSWSTEPQIGVAISKHLLPDSILDIAQPVKGSLKNFREAASSGFSCDAPDTKGGGAKPSAAPPSAAPPQPQTAQAKAAINVACDVSLFHRQQQEDDDGWPLQPTNQSSNQSCMGLMIDAAG